MNQRWQANGGNRIPTKNSSAPIRLPIRFLVGLCVAILLVCASASAGWAAEFDQTHARLADVLQRFVKDSLVDYAALKADRAGLDTYLGELATVPEADFNRWPETHRLAFLLNLYNAQTLALILDHYPLKSIRDIGVLPLAAWKKPVVRLWGRTTTLQALENDLIRKRHPETPEIHFALVCAALGCPPLRGEPYTGARLDGQLRDQGRQFMAATAKNRVDDAARVVWLSKIFDWYEADFRRPPGSVLAFAEKYFPPDSAAALKAGGFKIKYTDYDWTLNDIPRQP